MTVTCDDFDAAAADLVLGFAPTPQRDELLGHAAGCASCGRQLAALTTIVDSLLELAPEAEPPVGFEAKAVAAMRSSGPARPSRRRRALRPVVVVGAAVAIAGALTVAGLLGRDGDEAARTADAAVTTGAGTTLGRVELIAAPTPKVVVVLEDDDWSGVWVCELRDDDGRWVEVGRWTATEASGGAWAATIDDELLDATRMRITSTGGAVIATSSPLH